MKNKELYPYNKIVYYYNMGNMMNVQSNRKTSLKKSTEYSHTYTEKRKRESKCIINLCNNELYKDTIYCFSHGVQYDAVLKTLYNSKKNVVENKIKEDLDKKLNN